MPHGFDPVQYDFYVKAYSVAELEEMRAYYEGVEAQYRELKQMCVHIAAAREADKVFPAAHLCRDVTTEANKQ